MRTTKDNIAVLYEDNHIIVVSKRPGDIVQGDKTGDMPLVDIVKEYLREKYSKPGNVFCGLTHRIDRPTSGAVIFAKTSKALSRMAELFRTGGVEKRTMQYCRSRTFRMPAHWKITLSGTAVPTVRALTIPRVKELKGRFCIIRYSRAEKITCSRRSIWKPAATIRYGVSLRLSDFHFAAT